MTRLTIRELASEVGRSPQTIKRYEKNGVIAPASRDRIGWRTYSQDDVRRITETLYPTEKPR